MCTSIGFKTKDFYFGRNMDLDYNFGESVVITPRNYVINFKNLNSFKTHLAIIGMATIIDDYPLYAEASNEKGLCIAGLNFKGNAYFNKELNNKKFNIAPFELILWILSQCENVSQAKDLLNKTEIVDIPFNDKLPNSTLHWHIADKNESIVLECTKNGMNIYNNPVNVMTNNPPFDFHLENLSLYLNLQTNIPKNCFSIDADIKPFCKGVGSMGLPGDFSSSSRLVKAAYLILNSKCNNDEYSSISQFFHILDSVSVINGSIKLENEKNYMTTYSCCINTSKGIYYFKTYNNNQINAIELFKEDINGNRLISFSINNNQNILWLN